MVPKLAMQSGDFGSLDSIHLFEVDEWCVLDAENSVEPQQIKCAAHDVGLRCIHSGRIQLSFAGEKYLLPRGDAEFAAPIPVRRNTHGRPLVSREEAVRPE